MDPRVTLRKLERVMREELNAEEREALLGGELTQELRARHVAITQDERQRAIVAASAPAENDRIAARRLGIRW